MAAKKQPEGDISQSTLFVRNLPYDATAAQLEEMFSDIGPVRKCYIVTDSGSQVSRGFGYVHVSETNTCIKFNFFFTVCGP